MKSSIVIVAVFVFVNCVWAAPANEPVPIVALQTDFKEDGSYHYNYETGDGVKASQDGTLKKVGEEAVEVVSGQFSYTDPEGKAVNIEYTADENGYQPVGDSVPKIPEPIARALVWIREHPQPEDKKN